MKSLYRRYRPIKLQDVVGQDQVTKPLINALKNGKISHAYLLIGPRGCGKTSVARILAHEVNGFKYELEDDYVDIFRMSTDKPQLIYTGAHYGDIIVDPKHTHIAMYVSKGIAKNIVNNELKKIKSSWSGQSNNDAWISAHLTQHTGLCIGNRSYAMVNRSGFYIFRCVKPDETKYHIGQPVK